MHASRGVVVVALVFLSNVFLVNVWLSSVAAAQPSDHQQSDQVIAERVLGPRWKQLSRRAGMIFAGTVLSTMAQTGTTENASTWNVTTSTATATTDRAGLGATPAVQLSFHVDEAIAGVEPGQVLTIHEWAGAWSMHRPMSKGQHILIFLYPPSRLGLTSPVGGSRGQVALDWTGKNVSAYAEKPAAAMGSHGQRGSSLRPPARDAGNVSVVQLARAIRSARSRE